MAGETSRNKSANNDLQQAREMFERRTSQRNKRKIIDLEATVQDEESKLSDQQIGKEVDWLQDSGTPSTRATQFVRTQAEGWRMKTLLAKAMDVQGEHAKQLRKLKKFSETMSHDHMAVVESSEFKLSAIHQQFDTMDKKLTVSIKLLKQTIGQDNKPSNMQKSEPSGDQQGNSSKPGQIYMSRPNPVLEMFKRL